MNLYSIISNFIASYFIMQAENQEIKCLVYYSFILIFVHSNFNIRIIS